MKKRLLAVLVNGLFFLCMTGMANADLITIGTAQFSGVGTAYNLIWDNDNNDNSVIWLDYTNGATNWTDQNAWAAGLALSYDINPLYTVAWDDATWRLPSAGANPLIGYNQTTSEMGDLFYNDLGLSGTTTTTTTAQLNATNFDRLIAYWYWSGAEYATHPGNAWAFYMATGYQPNYPTSPPMSTV